MIGATAVTAFFLFVTRVTSPRHSRNRDARRTVPHVAPSFITYVNQGV
jgi:hypothetical protein